uniref:Uncharacterized protein n=1 Tax=viral metagenome TaxID=1070528 RepID=A0A6C0DZG4_9ZZZZ
MEDTAIFIEENKAKAHKAKQEAQDKLKKILSIKQDNFKETKDKIQKKAENFASDIKNAKQEAQNKLEEILSKGKQETQDKFKETKDEIQTKAENYASDIKNAKQEAQNKLEEILSRGKQEAQDKFEETKDEIQTKAQDILEGKNDGEVQTFWNKIKNYGKKIFNFGGSINRSPSLYSTTKQHYLNLKSMY